MDTTILLPPGIHPPKGTGPPKGDEFFMLSMVRSVIYLTVQLLKHHRMPQKKSTSSESAINSAGISSKI
jgi:hypothetical protein